MLTKKEVAALLKVSVRTITREIKRERLKPDRRKPIILINLDNPYLRARL